VTLRLRGTAGEVLVEVADTGSGIPPDQLEHIFERFYRVNGAAARKNDGSGLGLALVKEIVDQHNGQVSVTSQPGEGSTFTVTLPAG
jgi:signal transduction histidine kinase